MGALVNTTAPSGEPVSLADAKTHMRVDAADENTYIESLIKAARQRVEKITGRSYVTQTLTWYLDRFPDSRELLIPRAPLASVTSIVTTDPDGDTETFDADNYFVDTKSEPARIVLKDGVSWPGTTVSLREANGIAIILVMGYGTSGESPSPFPVMDMLAIKMLANHWFENREAVTPLELRPLPMGVEALLAESRSWNRYGHARVSAEGVS